MIVGSSPTTRAGHYCRAHFHFNIAITETALVY